VVTVDYSLAFYPRKSTNSGESTPLEDCTVSKAAISTEGDDRRLVYAVPEAGALLGLNRNAAYAAAKRGELGEIIQLGRQKRISKAAFHRKFGLPTD
jgi:hypothetical protein